jgi:poly-gamma-glutamate capsule biosynthesis protein CapA/YwtB (metallophosphatase superfamily)
LPRGDWADRVAIAVLDAGVDFVVSAHSSAVQGALNWRPSMAGMAIDARGR